MFTGDEIAAVVVLLKNRKVHLYHACQYQDFLAYLEVGGIPSRKLMEDTGKKFTPFDTDSNDKKNGVWDKVFLNFADFGDLFAAGRSVPPLAYGPILFRFDPEVLIQADDLSITPRSAGAYGFNREEESIKSIDKLEKLFKNSSNHSHPEQIIYGEDLQKEFGESAQSPEINCSSSKGKLSFAFLVDILVDPYKINGIDLSELVQHKLSESIYKVSVKRRKTQRENWYQTFIEGLKNGYETPSQFASINADLDDWAESIQEKKILTINFRRFSQYLKAGTCDPVYALGKSKLPIELSGVEYGSSFEDTEFLESGYDYFLDNEMNIIFDELGEIMDNWARSSDDGWFYED